MGDGPRRLEEPGDVFRRRSVKRLEPDRLRDFFGFSNDVIQFNVLKKPAVRNELEKLGAVVPTDQDMYGWLCEVGTHVSPRTRPQSHNDEKRPVLGAVMQHEGWKVSMESLAWSVCTVSGPLAKLMLLKKDIAHRLVEEAIELAELIFPEESTEDQGKRPPVPS